MIKWNSVTYNGNTTKYISEDGRFEIKKEAEWYLYDDNTPDRRWCRYTEDSLESTQNHAERILQEERMYDSN